MYIFRHSALTEKSQILKEHVLRDHAGWTMTSKMPQVYIHYFGTESSRSLLEARGIIKEKDHRVFQLRPKQCPNCNEPNKPDSKFCKHCRMVLSYDAYEETIQEQKAKDDRLAMIESQVAALIEYQRRMQEIQKLQDSRPIEEKIEHAKAMKTYQDIEDAMVKTGMIREEDRAENATYDVNEDEATRKKIYEKAEAIISKWKKRKNPIIYWYIWYQSSYKLHYIFSRKY